MELCHYVTPKYYNFTIQENLFLNYQIWISHPSSSVVRLPVDEPALASIMTHDHAKDLCASELGPLTI